LGITQQLKDQRIKQLESNVALIQASSGLEKLMQSSPIGPIKDSSVAQISAYLYYQANVLAKLQQNAAFQELFKTTIFNQINKDFAEYIDASARVKPKSLHHIYEWGKVGVPGARLFELRHMSASGLAFKVGYVFLPSKTPVPITNSKQKKKYYFVDKAAVMESGKPVIIAPKGNNRLVFEIDGQTVFMPKGASLIVKNPGGSKASHQFELAYGKFFGGQMVNASIKASGFQQIFNSKISKALSVPLSIKKIQYSFSPGRIRSEADAALTSSFGGVL